MLNRPPELEKFLKLHGFPLEVGMVVRVNGNRDFTGEYTVLSIRCMNLHSKCDVVIANDYKYFYTFSPSDLAP